MELEKIKGLTEGRIAHYVLAKIDVENIQKKRNALGFIGNPVKVGQHIPMMIVCVLSEHGMINGRLFLDGEDPFLWVQSRPYSDKCEKGAWHWIERA